MQTPVPGVEVMSLLVHPDLLPLTLRVSKTPEL